MLRTMPEATARPEPGSLVRPYRAYTKFYAKVVEYRHERAAMRRKQHECSDEPKNYLEIHLSVHNEDRLVSISVCIKGQDRIPGWTQSRIPLSEVKKLYDPQHALWTVWRPYLVGASMEEGVEQLKTNIAQIESAWDYHDAAGTGQ